MKPFLIATGDLVTTGGMDRANYALAWRIAQQGAPLHLVAYRVAPELTDLPNVSFHQVSKIAGSYLLTRPVFDRVGRSWAKKIAQQGGRVIVNGGGCIFPDVNWVHYVNASYAPSGGGSLFQRTKRQVAHRLGLRSERKAIQKAKTIIVNSELTRNQLLNSFELDPSCVHVVYYGIDPDLFCPGEAERASRREELGWPVDRPQVAFIGAFGDHRKGFETVFQAWEALCKSSDWDADLVVIGRGAELENWKQQTESAGLGKRIRFLGFRQDVPKLLQTCDALVAPTRYEAYGLNVHEALCCALPAFVSANAGVAERYPEGLRHLLLPDPTDATDLAKRLQDWRSNPEEHKPQLHALSEHLRSQTWDFMADNILQILDETDFQEPQTSHSDEASQTSHFAIATDSPTV